MAKGQR